MSAEDEDPLVFVLFDEGFERRVRLDEPVFINAHGKPETEPRGVIRLSESSNGIDQEDEENRIASYVDSVEDLECSVEY